MGEKWTTKVTKVEPNKLTLRGYQLDELIGKLPFSSTAFLAITGRLPESEEGKLFDAILTSSVDHGVTPPSCQVARTLASTGVPPVQAVAGGISTISDYHGGAITRAMEVFYGVPEDAGKIVESAQDYVARARSEKRVLFGFGHRYHNDDPRTRKLLSLARELGYHGGYCAYALALADALGEALGRRLPLNVDGAIAALLCELGFSPDVGNLIFALARVPGLIAHVMEEKRHFKPMRRIVVEDHLYEGELGRGL
ncbi:MAG: citryl-CoA lyase [Candidatus Coatesbacteria bacterium]|nr:citryl-CoA lyase [Candidatus Coatesbacteria bacterium]